MSGYTPDTPQRRDYTKRTLREQAFHVISGERDYQQEKYPKGGSLHDYIKLVQTFAGKLNKASTTSNPVQDTLHVMREIAALAVRAMEEHGSIYRVK